jgi:hypothetical protein
MRTLAPCAALSAALLGHGVAAAQQNLVVVPPTHAGADAPGRTGLVGQAPQRTQVLIDAELLTPLVGHRIHAVLLRRDAQLLAALNAGTWDLVLRIAPAARSAATALPDWAANAPHPVEVFRGTLPVPASPSPIGPPGWSSTETVRIDFAQPQLYLGGALAVDFETRPLGSDWWPIDAVDEALAGRVSSLGSPCGRFAAWPWTARADEHEFVVGRTATIRLQGDPGSAAWLLFGAAPLGSPLELSSIGAPGCHLHTLPFAALGSSVAAPHLPSAEFGGPASVSLQFPADSGLLGAALTVQWFEWQSGGFAFSNALVGELALAAPNLGMAVVVGQLAGAPSVRSRGIPVLGFVSD